MAREYTDDEIDKMSEDDAKSALKKCMEDEDEEAEDEEDEEDEEAEEDEQPKTAKGMRRLMAREVERVKALQKLDAKYSRLMGCNLLADKTNESAIAEAVRKGKSPRRFERECIALARSKEYAV